MTAPTVARDRASAQETDERPAYVVVLARLLVEAAFRELRQGGPANDNESTLVDREDL